MSFQESKQFGSKIISYFERYLQWVKMAVSGVSLMDLRVNVSRILIAAGMRGSMSGDMSFSRVKPGFRN